MPIDQSLRSLALPWIAPRAALVLVGLVSAGALALIVPVVTPKRPVLVSAMRSSVGCLTLGAGVRFVVQHHKSRLQMAVLLGVVAIVEAVRYRRGAGHVRVASWLAGSGAVCIGVLAAKWALEPGALSNALTDP